MTKKRISTSIICLILLFVSMLALSACKGKVNNFNLSFKVDGEVFQTITTTGNEGITIPENPTKTGYEFDGWYWDKDVWSQPFTANSLLEAPISSDMSVYAKFDAIEYNIIYNNDGGAHSNPTSYTVEDSFVLEDASKTGYTFIGWFSDALFTNQVTQIDIGTTGNKELFAKFTTTIVEEKAYLRIDANGNESTTGDYILFGEYPQTIKADSVTITTTQNDKGYYLGSDGNYYAKVVADVFGSGYEFSTGDTITEGATYYFKVEPIKWRILTESNGQALILCEMIIDAGAYDAVLDNNYANSDIRAWLNNEFYNTAFNDLQKEIILTTTVDNSARSANPNNNATQWNNGVNDYACENTTDKVFLLSMQEVTNSAYGFDSDYSEDYTVRIKQGTDYAKCNNLYVSTSGSYYGNSNWWLRSPYYDYSYIAWSIDSDGYAYRSNYVSSANRGVVPALNIQL